MTKGAGSEVKFISLLDQITAEIRQHVPVDKLHHVRYFPFYDQLSERYPVFLTITRLSSLVPFYVCNRGLKYLGFRGHRNKLEQYFMQFYHQVLQPENLHLIQRRINHFYNKPDQDFALAYQVKTADHGWKWVYGLSRLLVAGKKEISGYIVTVGRDIDALLNDSSFSGSFTGTGMSPKEHERFQQLSAREKQILQMYSLGKKNGEVSKLLGISPQTLQTHRKNIYKKLHISDSGGLVRYAMLLGNK